jgi:hypothetical protein
VQAPRDRHQDREDTRPYVSRRSGRQHKPNDNLERVPHRTLPLAVWPTGSPNPARQRPDAKTIRTQAGRYRQSRMGKGVGADELAAGQNQLEARARDAQAVCRIGIGADGITDHLVSDLSSRRMA